MNDTPTRQKSQGIAQSTTEKPARIVLDSGRTLDVAHHFRSEDGWVCAYDEELDGGIDYRVPRERITVLDTSEETVGDAAAGDSGSEIIEGQLATSGGEGR